MCERDGNGAMWPDWNTTCLSFMSLPSDNKTITSSDTIRAETDKVLLSDLVETPTHSVFFLSYDSKQADKNR